MIDIYPAISGVITLLLTLIGWMAVAGLRNNTKAMDRLTGSLDRIEERIGVHDVKLENHGVRLDKGGL